MINLIILTSDSMSSNTLFRDIIINSHKDIKAIIISDQVSGNLFGKVKRYYKLFRKMSFKFFLYKLIEGKLYILLIKFKKVLNFFNTNYNSFLIKDLAKKYGIPYYKINDINEITNVRLLKSFNPELILCYSSPILNKDMLECAKIACLNCHFSLLPKYKGAAQYIWYLTKKEKKGGVTIHYMTLKIDGGDILKQKEFVISKYDTAFSLHYKMSKIGSDLFLSVINDFKERNVKAKKQGKGNYYSIPTKDDLRNFPWKKLIKIEDLKLS